MTKHFINKLIIGFCLLTLATCGNKGTESIHKDKETASAPLRIQIYSYGIHINAKAEFLKKELEKSYPIVELAEEPLALPAEHYNKARNRYSGTGLLKDLEKHKNGNVVLGITDKVIFKANELSPTYGIFGISLVGKHVAIVSTTTPSGKKLTNDHQVKLMLHELGHAFGLKHCSDESCIMVDAKHGNKFSRTPSFCQTCKQHLKKNGWKL